MRKILFSYLIILCSFSAIATDNEKELIKAMHELKQWKHNAINCPSQREFQNGKAELEKRIADLKQNMSQEEISNVAKKLQQEYAETRLHQGYRRLLVLHAQRLHLGEGWSSAYNEVKEDIDRYEKKLPPEAVNTIKRAYQMGGTK